MDTFKGKDAIDSVPVPGNLFVSIAFLVVAGVVWAFEVRKRGVRVAGLPQPLGRGWLCCRYVPEILGLLALVACVSIVLLGAKHSGTPTGVSDSDWQDITREWPVLVTADSLLAMQAMLRLLVLISAALRGKGVPAAPIVGAPAVLFLFAAVCRVSRIVLSPAGIYGLDGPLGGKLNMAFEISVLPLLLYLSRSVVTKFDRVFLLSISVSLAAWIAHRNQLALADPPMGYLDVSFSLEHLLEFFAAATVLVGTVAAVGNTVEQSTFANFGHAVLPLQQFLPMYFLFMAFEEPFEAPPDLVRAGHPFELLRIAGSMQVVMYLFAGALHYASCIDAPASEGLYLEV